MLLDKYRQPLLPLERQDSSRIQVLEDSREFRSLGWTKVRGKGRAFSKRESLGSKDSDPESEGLWRGGARGG